MDYYKLSISIKPDTSENREIVIATLGNAGFESFSENDSEIEAYIMSDCYNLEIMDVLEYFPEIKTSWISELIPDKNWNEEWEKNYFEPLLIANKCLIRAPFHQIYPDAKYNIIINPKMAFGTGNHETTSLMIEHLIAHNLIEKKILDMGCGTGILAIFCSILGSSNITAIDIDQWSFENTIENAELNNITNINTYKGDSSLLTDHDNYDIILANIHKNVLINDLEKYSKSLNRKGSLFMSGFYLFDLNDIVIIAEKHDLQLTGYLEKNNWVAAKFEFKNSNKLK